MASYVLEEVEECGSQKSNEGNSVSHWTKLLPMGQEEEHWYHHLELCGGRGALRRSVLMNFGVKNHTWRWFKCEWGGRNEDNK